MQPDEMHREASRIGPGKKNQGIIFSYTLVLNFDLDTQKNRLENSYHMICLR